MGKKAGKPHHFSTLLHHLFKVQGSNEMHADFLARLETAISRSVFGEAKRQLEKLFALKLSLSLIWIACFVSLEF